LNGDERQDPEDDVEETAEEDEVDTFGIDAATRKAEQDVEAAESTGQFEPVALWAYALTRYFNSRRSCR
jgi:hypothetical protein